MVKFFFPGDGGVLGRLFLIIGYVVVLALKCKSLADLSERSTMLPFNSWITGALIPQPVATPAESSFFGGMYAEKLSTSVRFCFQGDGGGG